MPKLNKNNRITDGSGRARLEQHEIWLNQGVQDGDSPTFNNLRLTGDLHVEGSATIDGAFTVLSTEILELADNIILINREETGSGVTLNLAGIEVERGTGTNYQFVFQESDDTFRSGPVGNLQALGHRENTPLNQGVSVWNNVFNRWDSKQEINLDIFFNSLTNSTSSATGNIKVSGGVGISKDIHIDGKIFFTGTFPTTSVIYTQPSDNDLQIQSAANIDLLPTQNVTIPANRSLTFHSTNQSITSDTSGNLTTLASGDIFLTPSNGKSVVIPNQIPLEFSTASERIYTDSSNNMNIESAQNINLTPSPTKRILIPVDIPLTFSNNNQYIEADTSNNLTVQAGSNIELTPGNLLNVKIPTDNGILFGSVGTQRISSNSSSELTIQASGDIFITPSANSDINIPNQIGLTFGGDSQKIEADTSGNLFITANTSTQKEIQLGSNVHVQTTTNSTSGTTGSLHINGGLGMLKTLYNEESIIIDSNESEAFLVRRDGDVRDTFKVNNSATSKVEINTGDGTLTNSSLTISTDSGINAKSLITLFGGVFDTRNGYSIGRGTNSLYSGRALTVNLPIASDYGDSLQPKFLITSNDLTRELFSVESNTGNVSIAGSFNLSGTENATNATSAAVVISGGLGVVKDIYTDGKVTIDESSVNALLVRKEDNSGDVLTVDTLNSITTHNSNVIIDHTTTDAFQIRTNGATRTLFKADTTNETLTFDALIYNMDTTDASSVSGGALQLSGGLGVVKKLFVGGESKMLSDLDMSLKNIKNVANPISDKDAANKEYVDLVKQGLFVKDSVKAATTVAGTLSTSFATGQAIDGYMLLTNDRILIKNQVDPIENGIYQVQASGSPLRTNDFDANDIASGAFVFVQEGTVNKSLGWICNSPTTADTIGTDGLSWTQFTGLGQVVAGSGLSKTFNTLDINVDSFSIEIDADILRIRDCTIGTGLTGGSGQIIQTTPNQSHVTQLGTITTGTWQATPVQVSWGGTGQMQFTQGNLLFGLSGTQLSTDTDLFFHPTTKRLGLGTNNSPSFKFHIQDTSNAVARIDADILGTQGSAYPELSLTFNNQATKSLLAMARTSNQFANGVASSSLVLAHDSTNSSSKIHLATNQQVRVTIVQSGLVGINNTDPQYQLDVNGTLHTTLVNTFSDNTQSTSTTFGALTLAGGMGVEKDVYLGGDLYLSGTTSTNPKIEIGKKLVVNVNTIEFNTSGNGNDYDSRITSSGGSSQVGEGYLSIDTEILSINSKNQTLLTSTKQSDSITQGSLILAGGLGVVKNANVGGSLKVEASSGNFMGQIEQVTVLSQNYINSGNSSRTVGSFIPLNIAEVGSTNVVWTFHSSGVVLTSENAFQIGGTHISPDGYTVKFSSTNSELTVIPTTNGDTLTLGEGNRLSDLKIRGTENGLLQWSSGTSNLLVESQTQTFRKNGIVQNVRLTTPDITDTLHFNAQSGPMTMNFGENGTHPLTVEFSNTDNSSSMTFTPGATSSSLVLTDNVTTTFHGPTIINDTLTLVKTQILSISNTDNSNSKWFYLGRINTTTGSSGGTEQGYTDITLKSGVSRSTNNVSTLHFIASTRGGVLTAKHSHYHTSVTSTKSKVVVYNDASNNFHIFIHAAPNTEQVILTDIQNHTAFTLTVEGVSSVPNGTVSGYTGSWVQDYTTNEISNQSHFTGDLTVEGTSVKISDNLPIIGYNNTNTTQSRDTGILYQRYQLENDTGLGDIVNDPPTLLNSIPSQASASSTQIILSNLASGSDDFYNGWWIKVISGANINQVRQIVDYNGSLRVATLNTVWTTQNPVIGDNVELFDTNYIASYYDEVNDRFTLGYTTFDPGYTGSITLSRTANLYVNKFISTDTTPSLSKTEGSLLLSGGISINQTSNALSVTSGGTITTLGGVSVGKDLRVGQGLFIGTSADTLLGDVYLRTPNNEITLHNDSISNYNFIDFVAQSDSNRAGILFKDRQLVLTSNTSNTTPNVATSTPSLVINTSNSFVGIGSTQNVTSQLTLVQGTFLGINTLDSADTSFLGLIGGGGNVSTHTRAARIELSGNERSLNEGLLLLAAGDTTSTTNGGILLETADTERLKVDYFGNIHMYNTTHSDNSSTGALIIEGGLSIRHSQNATSVTNGGSLTVRGGAAIGRDLYVDGNLIVSGSLSGGGSVVTPTLTFTNTTNCTVNTYENTKVLLISTESIFSTYIQVTPVLSSLNTSFEFDLPGRTVNWTGIHEFIGMIQGFVNSSDPIQLFNTNFYAITGTTRVRVKFQSVSTGAHYINLIGRYISA